MAVNLSAMKDIIGEGLRKEMMERWDDRQTATEVRRRQEMAMQEMQARYGLRTGRERDEYYRKNSPYYTFNMADLDEKFEREAKADAKLKQIEIMQKYMMIQPALISASGIMGVNAAILGIDIDDKLYAESPTPSPRAELEQRCKDKGLDPSFARELDID